jgi:hypothetical protein
MLTHLRWGEAMGNRDWGWREARTRHASSGPLSPSLCDPHIQREYRYLRGARDDRMAMAHALKASPECVAIRRVPQGLFCARSISLEGIASLLELDAEVVRLFEALFSNVRKRGDSFSASVMFPETRIGAVVEAEKDFHETELTLMRVGRDYGWKEVARLAGLRIMEDEAESTEDALADMERTVAANARMLARAGHLNRKDSLGVRHGKTLIMRPKPEAMRPQTDDDKVGIGSFGMKAPVLEHFRRITDSDTQCRLAWQRQERMREEATEARAAVRQQ